MKKIIAFSFLLISINVYGQDDRRKKDSIALFAPTEKGVPDGETISEKIGNNGGRLISSDKKVAIIIPAGALPSETMISIQPLLQFDCPQIGKKGGRYVSPLQWQMQWVV